MTTPPDHYNRPGLRALVYRADTHATFLRRMFSRISGGPLGLLKTRSDDDPAIALLDAWAIVADVFTFYQERIANEGFLRTATERRSLLELARSIGYELRPGVAAGAFLAFTVEEPDALKKTRVVTVPKGTKVQSIPSQGQMPQTFETGADLVARYDWNALRPRLTRPFIPGLGAVETVALNHLTPPKLGPHDWAVFGRVLDPEGKPVRGVQVRVFDRDRKYDDLLGDTQTDDAGNFFAVYHERDFAETNENLPELYVMVNDEAGNLLYSSRDNVRSNPQRIEFFEIRLNAQPVEKKPKPERYTGSLYLAGVSTNLKPGDFLLLIYTQPNGQIGIPARVQSLAVNKEYGHTRLELVSELPIPENILPDSFRALAFKTRLGFFGCNAPDRKSLPDAATLQKNLGHNPYPYDWDAQGWEIWKDPNTNDYFADADIYLERNISGVVQGDWLVIQNTSGQWGVYRAAALLEASRYGFGLSAKVTGLKLTGQSGLRLENNTLEKPSEFKVRESVIYLQGETLELAEIPITEPLAAGATNLVLDQKVDGLQVGQWLALSGEREDAPGETAHELLTLDQPPDDETPSTLRFRDPLQYAYIRKTITVNANVTRATHGETMREVLGSGDGSQANQRFTLKRLPLTYISAPTAEGAQSTLEVRANDVLWDETPSLHGTIPGQKAYQIRIQDDGATSITFGDGQSGARLPSGMENITAVYRTGLGPDGEVPADTLSLLQTRPQGIRSVTNPLAASGAAARDDIETARAKAPLRVLTMDRLVSLRDYEYFAGVFAGVGKVQATALWDGKTRLAHLTVAGIGGEDIAAESDLYRSLLDAIHTHRDPLQPVWIDPYQRCSFDLSAKVLVDSHYQAQRVFAAARLALTQAFSFEQRAFGQPVTAAELITLMQRLPGVVAVDLDFFCFTGETKTLRPILNVQTARWDVAENKSKPAELLTLNPVGIILEEMLR